MAEKKDEGVGEDFGKIIIDSNSLIQRRAVRNICISYTFTRPSHFKSLEDPYDLIDLINDNEYEKIPKRKI